MVTYQMTLSLVHIYDFVAFTQVNFVMTQLIDYSLLLIAFITSHCSSGDPKDYVFPSNKRVYQ